MQSNLAFVSRDDCSGPRIPALMPRVVFLVDEKARLDGQLVSQQRQGSSALCVPQLFLNLQEPAALPRF